jgi:hypothetical protein
VTIPFAVTAGLVSLKGGGNNTPECMLILGCLMFCVGFLDAAAQEDTCVHKTCMTPKCPAAITFDIVKAIVGMLCYRCFSFVDGNDFSVLTRMF